MKITIIYDNTSLKKNLKTDWGFSALIEIRNKKILFDTGASFKILSENMKKLKINIKEITDVFISHFHFDHTGGLSGFLEENKNVTVWVGESFRGIKNVKKLVYIKKAMKLYDGIFSTGEIENIEQSLCLKTKKGILIIVGCAHPKMKKILKEASKFGKVYGILGGLHNNRPETLKNLNYICGAHCTKYKKEFKEIYSNKYLEGGIGYILKI